MESKKINQLATELAPVLSDLTIIGDPTTGISKKITLSQMASLFTGTVEEYPNLASFPLVGTADTIYIALDTNIIYRWNTSTNAYVELSPNIVTSLVFNDANGFDGTINLVGSTATLTITTALTTGSVGFIGASGALLQDNANFFWDDTNNRLGLGTNAPTTALDAFGSGIIGRLNGTSTNNAFLGFASAGSNKWSIGNVQSDHRFRIYNDATTSELVSVLQTGEFGIGIANPTTKLHIDGGASALIANLDANVSVAKSVSFRSDNSNRFNIEVSGTESASNAGADFFIRRYSDAGSLIDTPLTITRSTGNATFSGILTTPQIKAATSAGLSINANSGTQVADFGAGGSANMTLFGGLSGTTASFNSGGTSNAGFFQINDGTTTLGNSFTTVHRNSNDGNGRFSLTRWQVQNTSGLQQSAFIGAQAVTGASNYSPNLILGVSTGASTYSTYLTIASTGAATFTSSITTGAFIKSSVTSGGSVITSESTATNGEGQFVVLGKNSSGTIRSGAFKYDNADVLRLGTSSPINMQFETNDIVRMRIDSDGTKYFGNPTGSRFQMNSSGENLYQYTNTYYIYGFYNDSNNLAIESLFSGSINFKTAAQSTSSVPTTGTTRMVIGNTGQISSTAALADWSYVMTNNNASSPNGLIIQYTGANKNNSSNPFLYCTDNFGASLRFVVYSNGNVQNQNNSYGAISDIKLKENITDASPKLNELLKVKIRNYNLIGNEKKQLGVIAQELEEIFPSMIDESEDFELVEITDEEGNINTEKQSLGTTTKSVKYSVFVPMLIKAIQEQQAQIEELKKLINK